MRVELGKHSANQFFWHFLNSAFNSAFAGKSFEFGSLRINAPLIKEPVSKSVGCPRYGAKLIA